ncbi:hypothetical protein SAMD00019534_035600 [Acytostelium subglobosum LB1]|uniref:hypothetical protein n=1 Tax=Acytostelium subglobosum LB1 TaxID=1410327 RepID=UPI0006450B92|nr:hypothetical protein SAMD00019534_035600 [Acytostelium subglobosum LB1]GAM20385.1 hypothetical protein SAMD00019534_035600 [Acytostelium subglobosum LB1]|eukprot:XP_012759906.1 hypothetical protein SAMD00019534_035600 [Acytostelium subglobosum LB1]
MLDNGGGNNTVHHRTHSSSSLKNNVLLRNVNSQGTFVYSSSPSNEGTPMPHNTHLDQPLSKATTTPLLITQTTATPPKRTLSTFDTIIFTINLSIPLAVLFQLVILGSKFFICTQIDARYSSDTDAAAFATCDTLDKVVTSMLLLIQPLQFILSAIALALIFSQRRLRSLFQHTIQRQTGILSLDNNNKESSSGRSSTSSTSSTSTTSTSHESNHDSSHAIDTIILWTTVSGFIYSCLSKWMITSSADYIFNDVINNFCSSLEFIIYAFFLNFEVTSSAMSRFIPRSVAIHGRSSWTTKLYLCLTCSYLFLMCYSHIVPLANIIHPNLLRPDQDLHFLKSLVKSSLYFLQITILMMYYHERPSYQLASLVITSFFFTMTIFDCFHLSTKLLAPLAAERLVIRRCIRAITLLIQLMGIAIDLFNDCLEYHRHYNQMLNKVDKVLQSNKQLIKQEDAHKMKATDDKVFFKNTINQIKKTLATANSNMGFLNDADVQSHQVPYLVKMSESFEHLSLITKECLYFDELQTLNNNDIERTSFNLECLLEDVIANPSIRSYFEKKDLDLCYLLQPGVPLNLLGDPSKLKNILLRLLNNSLKATFNGEIVIRVSSTTRSNGGGNAANEINLTFTIIDTGVGIDPEAIPLLFEPYALTKQGYEEFRVGLGLGICSQLSKLLGGTLKYDPNNQLSAPGDGRGACGSIFTLDVPLEIQAKSSMHTTPTKPASHQPATTNVLVIDDNPNINSAIEMHLEPQGLAVTKAHTFAQGLSLLKSGNDYNIVFIDSMIPNLNIDLIRQTKQQDPTKSPYSHRTSPNMKPLKKEQLLTIINSLKSTSPFVLSHYSPLLSTPTTSTCTPTTSSGSSSTYQRRTPPTLLKQNSAPKLTYQPLTPIRSSSFKTIYSNASSNASTPLLQSPCVKFETPTNSGCGEQYYTVTGITSPESASTSPMQSPKLKHKGAEVHVIAPLELYTPAKEETTPLHQIVPTSINPDFAAEQAALESDHQQQQQQQTVVPQQQQQTAAETMPVDMEKGDAVASAIDTSVHQQEYMDGKRQQSQMSTSKHIRTPSTSTSTGTSAAISNIRILLVEDNQFNARIATTVLQKHSFRVDLKTNGQVALEHIKGSHSMYDLILMDIHMPVMDGITCTRMIRRFESEQGFRKIPIIALTADNTSGHKNTCLDAGCNEYISKPLDYPILISVLKKLLDNSAIVSSTPSGAATTSSNEAA